MIPVYLSANCEGWIYDPNGSGIRTLGIRSRDPFSGSAGMSATENRKFNFALQRMSHLGFNDACLFH